MTNVRPILGHIGEGEWCRRDGSGIEMRVTFEIWILWHPVEAMRLVTGTLMQTEVAISSFGWPMNSNACLLFENSRLQVWMTHELGDLLLTTCERCECEHNTSTTEYIWYGID